MLKIKKNLVKLKRKRSGKTKINKKNVLYLNRNEKIINLDIKFKIGLSKKIAQLSMGHYPNFDQFYSQLSSWIGVNKNEVFLSEGVSGAIKSLIEVYCSKDSNVIVPDPTFAMYQVYAKMFEVKLKKFKYNSNFVLNYEEIFNLIDENTSLIFLPCPNIPVDTTIKNDFLHKLILLAVKKRIMIVLDEVYFLFSKFDGLKFMKKNKNNVVILRSFSKAFGLAGIRLGYMISSKKNIEYISKTRTGYETNSLSICVGSFFISNYSIVSKYITDVKEGIKYLKKELKKLNIENYGGYNSNYVFLNFSKKIEKNNIFKNLTKQNVHVRDGWPKPFDKGFLVSAGPKYIMIKFLITLKKSI